MKLKIKIRILLLVLLISSAILLAGCISLVHAQEPTPTTETTPQGPTGDELPQDGEGFFDLLSTVINEFSVFEENASLSSNDLLRAGIAILVFLLAYFFGGRITLRVLRQLAKRTPTDYDDGLVEALKNQIRLLIIILGYQVATLLFFNLSEALKEILGTINFYLYWYLFTIALWKAIDYSGDWYFDKLKNEKGRDDDLITKMRPLVIRVGHAALIIISASMLLASWGVSLLAIMAALGISGFALSLALKDTITNIISGLVLMISRPFEIGDRIEITEMDLWADVTDIGVRSTTVLTRDNRMVIVPNSLVVDNSVVNYSRPDPSYRLQADVGIGAGMDIESVVKLIHEAVRSVEGVMPEKSVDVLFIEFGDSSNTFRIRWWVESYTDKRRVTHQVLTTIQKAADKYKIDMPIPAYAVDNQISINPEEFDQLNKKRPDPDKPEE
jgi:small-conductance mechanosensitive channel